MGFGEMTAALIRNSCKKVRRGYGKEEIMRNDTQMSVV